MELNRLKSILESLLFASGDPVSQKDLEAFTGCGPEEVEEAISSLKEDYSKEYRGIDLIRLNDSWQLCSKHDNYVFIAKMASTPRRYSLTEGQLEVLSIIAYKQPVTRSVIDGIRGVNSSSAVSRLLEMDLIREAGRLKTPGRPILLATTDNFLRAFGVESEDDMPVIDPVKVEEFKAEAVTETEDTEERTEDNTQNPPEEGSEISVTV